MHRGTDSVGGHVAHVVDVAAVDAGLERRQVRLLADRHRQSHAPKLRKGAGHRLGHAGGDGIGECRRVLRLVPAHRVHERVHPLRVFALARPGETASRVDHDLDVDPSAQVRFGGSTVINRLGRHLFGLTRLCGTAHAALTNGRPLDQIVGARA